MYNDQIILLSLKKVLLVYYKLNARRDEALKLLNLKSINVLVWGKWAKLEHKIWLKLKIFLVVICHGFDK